MVEVRGFGLEIIGLTQGVFGLGLVAAEIPTGYIGDRIGRRASLALSSVITTVVMIGYVIIESPLAYVTLYGLWAFGWAFESGTGDAWLYELLREQVDESAFTKIRGRGDTISLLTSAVSAALSGLLVTVNWSLPFVAGALLSAVGIFPLVTLPAVNGSNTSRFTIRDGARVLSAQVTHSNIRWFVFYSALFYGLFDVTRAFEQAAMTEIGIPAATLGLLYAALKLTSAAAAATTGWFKERVGIRLSFVLLIPIVASMYLVVGLLPVAVVPVIFLTRSIQCIINPLRLQYLNDRIEDFGRATVLSGISMVLSLAGGVANLIAGTVAGQVGLFRFLAIAGLVVAVFAGVVWRLTTPIRSAVVETPSKKQVDS